MTALSWLLFALSCIGAFNVGAWSRRQVCELMSIIDEWANNRAFVLCGQAILDYEFNRGVDGLTAWKYARRMM